jgi:hypothetical protein
MNDENPENLFGDVIFSYTRKQAIEDGVLVDLSQVETIRGHWKFPFACTAAAWGIIEETLKEPGQDLAGICHDISMVAKMKIRGGCLENRIEVMVVIAGKTQRFDLHSGPGDRGEPVLTLMLPGED